MKKKRGKKRKEKKPHAISIKPPEMRLDQILDALSSDLDREIRLDPSSAISIKPSVIRLALI